MENSSGNTPENTQKNDPKTEKMMMKVMHAILSLERNTAQILEGLLLMCQNLPVLRNLTDVPSSKIAAKSAKEQLLEKWLDKQDLMEILHISERSLYSLRKSGALPGYSFRGKIYFKAGDVEALLQKKNQHVENSAKNTPKV